MSTGAGALVVRSVVHPLQGTPANDAQAVPPVKARVHALLRAVPATVHLGEREELTRDDDAFRWIPFDAEDPEPIFLSPWDRWLEAHPEEMERHAGRHVALHPTLGVYASAASLEDLYEQLRGRTLPGVALGDLLLTAFGRAGCARGAP